MRTKSLLCLSLIVLLAGCASLPNQRLAAQLADAMRNQNDPDTVRAGAPAYLLLLDSLIAENPGDPPLLIAGADLYGAYAAALTEDGERRQRLTDRAWEYASRALCEPHPAVCETRAGPFPEFSATLDQLDRGDLPALYSFGTSWIGWIEARSDDWNALADLPKAEQVMRRVVTLDPAYRDGRAQLYLAALLSLRPPAMGGQPELAREHFERAIAYSEGRDLMAKVEYARRYARLTFDRQLHDRLLEEVLQSDPTEPGLTLSNVLAQREARILLAESYF